MIHLKYGVYVLVAFSMWPLLAAAQTETLSPILQGSYDPTFESDTDISNVAAGLRLPSREVAPKPAPSALVGFDQITNTMFVNGFIFDAGDHQAALASKSALDNPPVQMPSNFRLVGVEEFTQYIQGVKYRMEHPFLARVNSVVARIKKHFRDEQKEYDLMKSRTEKAVGQCFKIAENKFPGDYDAARKYKNKCVDNLPGSP